MHKHEFKGPKITGAKTEGEWVTSVLLWIAFRKLRHAEVRPHGHR
jgi:hypothetical protein